MIIKNVKKVKQSDDDTKFNYWLTDNNNLVLTVPPNEENRYYQEILRWVADGNTIEEAD
tara:strand:+ start:400 stop:576 length:177 start_codon:yes stop_codon:yes gene_type:complete